MKCPSTTRTGRTTRGCGVVGGKEYLRRRFVITECGEVTMAAVHVLLPEPRRLVMVREQEQPAIARFLR
jgi:hypothetical protein